MEQKRSACCKASMEKAFEKDEKDLVCYGCGNFYIRQENGEWRLEYSNDQIKMYRLQEIHQD